MKTIPSKNIPTTVEKMVTEQVRPTRTKGYISSFMEKNFRHFNAGILLEAAKEFRRQIEIGNKMMLAMAGAMSTAEIGVSLAEMIRQDKIHLICCTGANLEEDIFNLIAHDKYERIYDWRNLSPQDEQLLYEQQFNRVTDTCIPEEAMRMTELEILKEWKNAEKNGERLFPHEYFFRLFEHERLKQHYKIPVEDSWVYAAYQKQVPIIVPGWEDSSIGNLFATACIRGDIKNPHIVKTGIEYMIWLAEFYVKTTQEYGMGMFQIGGGIAGDFPICVVPMLNQDLKRNVRLWSYFCQVSDSTTSYGSYSGAIPNEKITWGKLAMETPKFIIESDATIVVPLIFAYVLGW